MTNTCPCGQPARDATLCARCTRTLEKAIANLSAYWQDLDNVRAKLTRYGGQGGPHGDRVPIDPRFAKHEWIEATNPLTGELEYRIRIPDGTALIDAIRNTITTWVRVVQVTHHEWIGPPCSRPCLHISCSRIRRSRHPADNIPACCMYLLGWTDRIRVAPWAADILDELTHLEQRLRQLVDRPGDRWYAGPCDTCERDLYANTGAPTVDCPDCDLTYDVAARRDWLLDQAEDHLVNAVTLARAITWLGNRPLTEARIRQWAHRGRIVAKGTEPRGLRQLPLYRIGDALDLLAAESQKAG